ncbi:alpha/beta hydrolase [Paraneptunicella aestuarii]|uniref:alpha/beta fold hydrolase n=1 Tax=Paraneptunicella aestuarii TaxID=2831148 RepID=UPI001E5E4A24|nr:alpha/beta hydrolase [Paraneptunicella aestuarii]UAA38975.1 alpha/beta hydrolase [Paraneptunicella aestuarii]
MKKTLVILTVLLASIFVLPAMLPLSVSQAVVKEGMLLEAELYGLQPYKVDIGDMQMTYYANLPDNHSQRPTLLLLHGYSADKNVWPRFAKHFFDKYYVLIPDMAGHGETGFNPDWSYRTPVQAERLQRFLTALNVQKAHLVGNSMGGLISAQFALHYPLQTLSVTLFNPSGVVAPEPSVMDNMLQNGRNPFEVNNRQEFDEFFAMTMAEPPWIPDFMLAAVAEKYRERKLELRHIFAQIHHQDLLEDKLNQIAPPMLLLWGEQDQIIDVSSVEVWKNGVPNIETHVWQNIGHMPMLEIPAESAKLVRNFIEKQSL